MSEGNLRGEGTLQGGGDNSGSQHEVTAFLADPTTHAAPVEVIETHSATIFLAGERAYKLKRAVKFDFLDFSTVERRREACEAEVRLNARTAPELYLRAAPITRAAGGRLRLGGEGEAVDWVVVMRRFDQAGLLDRLAAAGRLPLALMRDLADEVGRLHADAEVRPDHGGLDGMRWVVEGNASAFDRHLDVLPADLVARVNAATREALDRHAPLIERRRLAGRVRQCHGDLHLRNIVLIAGRPVIFDAVEFNDRIACTDVLYDLAFLVMDLLRTGLPAHAAAVVNRYLEVRDELDGMALMPLFLSVRAAIRAKVAAIEARVARDLRQTARDRELARIYLEDAEAFLRLQPARVIAIGGPSGAGKTTLAGHLAAGLGTAPGALVIRSDVIRKRLRGVPPEQRLGPEAYTEAMSRRVYAELCARVRTAVAAGYTAIADAVFARADARAAVEDVARDLGVPFQGFWLEAPIPVMAARLASRVRDASDATPAVLARQVARPADVPGWTRLDASLGADELAASARAIIE